MSFESIIGLFIFGCSCLLIGNELGAYHQKRKLKKSMRRSRKLDEQ